MCGRLAIRLPSGGCDKHVSVQGGGQAPQQGDGRLGSALFDPLDLIDSHLSLPGQVGDTTATFKRLALLTNEIRGAKPAGSQRPQIRAVSSHAAADGCGDDREIAFV